MTKPVSEIMRKAANATGNGELERDKHSMARVVPGAE